VLWPIVHRFRLLNVPSATSAHHGNDEYQFFLILHYVGNLMHAEVLYGQKNEPEKELFIRGISASTAAGAFHNLLKVSSRMISRFGGGYFGEDEQKNKWAILPEGGYMTRRRTQEMQQIGRE
jgi:hypothetical protein